MLRKLQDVAKEAQATLTSIPNTKTEIKRAISDMASQILAINRKFALCDIPSQTTTVAETKVSQGICIETQAVSVTQRDIAVQTIPIDERRSEELEREKKDLQQIYDVTDKGTVFSEIGQILDRQWPGIAFSTVKDIEENPLKSSQRHDIILFLDPKQKYDKGIVQDALERFPEIKDIISDGCEEGKIEYINNETRTSRKMNSEEDRTSVYILLCNIDERGVNDMEGIFNLLVNLSNVPKKLVLVTPTELYRLYVRKIAEFVMHGRCEKVD
nr:unnamed protein product [Callosobruchus chinensis]